MHKDYEYLPDPNVEAVRSKLLNRSMAGFNKYGCTTAREDLSFRDWLRHLQEELLDGAVYIERMLKEQAAESTPAELAYAKAYADGYADGFAAVPQAVTASTHPAAPNQPE